MSLESHGIKLVFLAGVVFLCALLVESDPGTTGSGAGTTLRPPGWSGPAGRRGAKIFTEAVEAYQDCMGECRNKSMPNFNRANQTEGTFGKGVKMRKCVDIFGYPIGARSQCEVDCLLKVEGNKIIAHQWCINRTLENGTIRYNWETDT